jgi:choline dehydrogenase-like flavoprotein
MSSTPYDYIIAGGGIAGTVLASRLKQSLPNLRILLIEAGPNATGNPLVTEIKNAFNVIGSELDWAYKTVPQKHLGGRVCEQIAGKALGGGSAINYCESLFPFLSCVIFGVIKMLIRSSWLGKRRQKRLRRLGQSRQ